MSRTARGLANPITRKKFREWMKRNCVNEEQIANLDLDAEFGQDLSYNEAVEVALHKFPSLWRPEYLQQYENRIKQIIFIRDLIGKIIDGKVQVTYRKSPKIGTYYVIENRFKQKADSSKLLIEFYRTDRIDPSKLTDEEAQLAGIDTADQIRALFEKWYGAPIPQLYQNWFKVKEAAE
ncbi:MAG: hypothetical protein ACRECH_02150 [Nitrososphaerales archaeon]